MARMLGRKTIRYDTVTSTNEVLKGLAADGLGHGTVVTARVQTQGKGRMSRTWESQAGGLWISVLLEMPAGFDRSKFGLIPLMAGSSVATAIMMEYDLDARVKWPNDVLVEGRKISGILCELVEHGSSFWAIIGIGVNVNNHVREGFEFSSSATSIIEEFGKSVKLDVLENTILEELDFRATLLTSGEFDKILTDWKELSATIGKAVSINTPEGKITGKALDIDDNGSLLVEENGQVMKVSAGDCQHMD
jgi:BirA family biotin operon repressor/biotin-[acetyl-CoA-carboxylase] ligase